MARLISSWPRRLWTEKYHWCVFDPFFVMSDMVNLMPRILRPVRQGSLYRNYLWPVDNAGLNRCLPGSSSALAQHIWFPKACAQQTILSFDECPAPLSDDM